MSTDKRYVAFASDASNIVSGDTGYSDIFVYDRWTGITERVSVSTTGKQANGNSFSPSISADGRYVAFSSDASNLISGDTNLRRDVFVFDRWTRTTERVSVSTAGQQGNSDSDLPSISADGRYVAFQSFASNLVTNDTNGVSDIFVYDRLNGTIERVSVSSAGAQAGGGSLSPSISSDGQLVAFASSAPDLIANDTNGFTDVFVRDRMAGTTERVSVSTTGKQANGNSLSPSISDDGWYVVFASDAPDLVSDDANGATDIFIHDRWSDTTERVSVSSFGEEANSNSSSPSVSWDGWYVAFTSNADNLVSGDTNGLADIFVYDRWARTIERVSVSTPGTQANGNSSIPSISWDGLYVVFASEASNLVSGDGGWVDIFVRDRRVLSTGLSDPVLSPTVGDTGTDFTYAVTYTQTDNLAPDVASVVIIQPDGTPVQQSMGTADTTYSDGSLYTYTTRLAWGSYAFYFHFETGGTVYETAIYAGPFVGYQMPTLSKPSLDPRSGTMNTEFTYSVTYTQGDNLAPDASVLVIILPDGTQSSVTPTTADTTYSDGSLYTYTTNLATVGTYSYYFKFKFGDSWVRTATFSGPTVYSDPTLSAPGVSPAIGYVTTDFTFSVTYTQAENVAPSSATVTITRPDGSRLVGAMTTTDTSYYNGSLYTYKTKLSPVGNCSYSFEFKMRDVVVTSPTYSGPKVDYRPPTLTDPSLSPSSGTTTTDFTYTVTYTQLDNQAPEYAYVVIIKPDGNKIWRVMTTSDTTYSDGSLYTSTTKLPVGSYSYYFQFKSGGKVVKTATYSGPTVYSNPTLTSPSLSPTTGDATTDFTFSVTYTQAQNQAPEYAYVVIIQLDGSKSTANMTTSDTTYSDGSLYTYTTKLSPAGTYSYYFEFKGAGTVVKTTTYTGPKVDYRPPTLTDPSLSPSSGTTTTDFTYTVTYTQLDNQAPEYAYVVIIKPDGNKIWRVMTTSDTTYSDGSLYTSTTKLPVGSYSYYFQFKSGGKVVKTATYPGPTVN